MKIVFPGQYQGNIQIPPSKSDSQRAILAAGLSSGKSILKNIGNSEDELVMLNFIREIGANIKLLPSGEMEIDGTKLFPDSASFNCGESGLSSRLIIAQCAAHDGNFQIAGEGSLLNRPMTFFERYLPQLGSGISSNEGFLPLQISGGMNANSITVDTSEGSQFLSAFLMALPLVEGESQLIVENLVSKPYIEMTLKTLESFGIKIQYSDLIHFKIEGSQKYQATTYQIEGDWSSASYWLIASALGQNIGVSGLNLNSLQADRAILEAFTAANCKLIQNKAEISIDGTNRKAFRFDATDCPDLFPALATFAALCNGISEIKGVKRLQHKESNRALALQEEFAKLGVLIQLKDDLMLIHGKDKFTGAKLSSHNDHRIAMCLAIAGMFAASPLEISNENAVNKSYPGFWDDLEQLNRN